MQVFIVRQPSGLYNGEAWPEVGEPIELDDAVATSMLSTGWVSESAPKHGKGRPSDTVETATPATSRVETATKPRRRR